MVKTNGTFKAFGALAVAAVLWTVLVNVLPIPLLVSLLGGTVIGALVMEWAIRRWVE